jgi:ribonuclease R
MSRSKISDPFASREAAKYDKPIHSREFILEFITRHAEPITHDELCKALDLSGENEVEALRRRLNAMRRDGQLMKNRRGAFGLIDKMNLLKGRIQGHKDNYGFFIPDEGGEDLFISHRQMSKVFDGDRVLVRPSVEDRRGKREGSIVEVLERAHSVLVGRYFKENGVGFVVPDNPRINQDILIADDSPVRVSTGQIVRVEIKVYPSGRNNAVGRIVEVLGDHLAPGMEVDIALRVHGIPFEWSDAVSRSLTAIDKTISDDELNRRFDLRLTPFVTIDGEDSRDFDDAVYCEAHQGGWRLLVAIADVSHFVRVGSALDKEAHERGTSVYFPSQVIPMLPELLSNELCSLNPQVERLAMVCEMTINASGRCTDYCFYEAVISSHARLTYTIVSQMLEHPDSTEGQEHRSDFAAIVPHIEDLYALYKVQRKARDRRGAIDFDSTETRIIFGDQQKIKQIVPVQRNEAHKLIEECMLCANVAAADFLEHHKITGLYRVHENPTEEKLADLREFLGELGLSLTGGAKPTAKDYRRTISKIQGRPDAHMIQTVLLRSMQQAVYSPDNEGHFGLAYDAYAHFTSPIRRYPDLLMHRAIRSVIRSRWKSERVKRVAAAKPITKKQIYPYAPEQMIQLGEHCSKTERRADEAVRDVTDWLKCEFVQDRVGEVFDGVITGVTAFGLFIELQDIYVEGLLHVSALSNDYYHLDAVKHRLLGERTNRSFSLGDKISVMVVRVDLEQRKIDFDLPQNKNKPAPKKKRDYKGAGKKGVGKKKPANKDAQRRSYKK